VGEEGESGESLEERDDKCKVKSGTNFREVWDTGLDGHRDGMEEDADMDAVAMED